MDHLVTGIQIILALGIFNVWLLRFGAPTPWRAGEAKNMRAEFAVYGLPPAVMFLAGGAKLLCAVGLLAGIWVPALVVPSAAALALFMAIAIAMHFKVRDPLIKSLPALGMLVLSLIVALHRGPFS